MILALLACLAFLIVLVLAFRGSDPAPGQDLHALDAQEVSPDVGSEPVYRSIGGRFG